VKAFFPEQLQEVTAEEFYRAINYSYPRFIRTEADELTYPFHVMIRYEIEKLIMEDKVTVEELPALWNKMYEEYLGITPETDTVGVLQDTHWSGGMFGYFPSYSLGTAIAAQLFHHMESVMPIRTYLEEGKMEVIREYLGEQIHKYGASKTSQELLKETTGEAFNPDYYIEYLTKKYTELYEL
jgi:carboxypeptidase Taq